MKTLFKTNFFKSFALGFSLLFSFATVQADALKIVAGGGYKKPMQAVIAAYEKASGQNVDGGYGNMRQILSQAKASSQIALVIGDRKFLAQTNQFQSFQSLGEGKLVLAWASSTQPIQSFQDLTSEDITRIARPHAQKAIYGRAAVEWLASQKLSEKLDDKIIQAATVPQVSAYLVAREIDAGFINLTDAIGLGDKIGGYLTLNDGYTPIEIVAGTVTGHETNAATQAFLTFMQSAEAQAIFKRYGM